MMEFYFLVLIMAMKCKIIDNTSGEAQMDTILCIIVWKAVKCCIDGD